LNKITGFGSPPGIYYGDARSSAELTHFGFDSSVLNANSVYLELVNLDTQSRSLESSDVVGDLVSRMSKTHVRGENRMVLDVHHEGKNVYFMEYVNGAPVGFGTWEGSRLSRMGAADHVGGLLRQPGDEAVFKNLRVSVLPD
jgi:hypothetical protein